MGRDQSRVVGLALAYLAATVTSLFVLDWYVIDLGIARVVVPPRSGGGFFELLGIVILWGTLLVTTPLVAYQALTRVASGVANEKLSRIGIVFAIGLAGTAFGQAYVFGPDVGRTLAPMMFIAAQALGIAALHYAALTTSDDTAGTYVPVVVARKTTEPPLPVPAPPKKKLSFVVMSGEVTRAGIDARREDGSQLLVAWRDVVGVVVRRLPDELDATTFVDIVSVKGSTLRVLPWTKLTGISVVGIGDERLRSVVAHVVASCPAAQLDPATRGYLEKGDPAAQLKDLAKLAAHDERLS